MDKTETTVHEYLESLPETVHNKLYQSSTTCLAIFRLLPSLSKFYIVSLLFQENSTISYPELNKWLKNSSQFSVLKLLQFNSLKIYQNESLKKLGLLNLIKESKRQIRNPRTGNLTNITMFQLNEVFKKNFKDSLIGNDDTNVSSDILTSSVTKTIDIEFLDQWSSNKWETILHFMVGTQLDRLPSDGVLKLLNDSGLMELPEFKRHYKDLQITKDGFQFLLQEINSQIWILLLHYLKASEQLSMNSVEVLNFIFLLGSLELGKGYSTLTLSATQQMMLNDLNDYGLIYQDKDTTIFYPTKLSTNLTSDPGTYRNLSQALNYEEDSSNGYIIIETNFKLYCYTESPLQIAILNLFVHLRTRFNNMVCGNITRESIRHALRAGITSDQIIKYLETHCHPQMKKLAEQRLLKKLDLDHTPGHEPVLELIPPTVIDQIKLWQLELERIQTVPGFLFKDFNTDQEFEKLSKYLTEIGILIWKDTNKKRFFVTDLGYRQVVEYANRYMRRSEQTPI